MGVSKGCAIANYVTDARRPKGVERACRDSNRVETFLLTSLRGLRLPGFESRFRFAPCGRCTGVPGFEPGIEGLGTPRPVR
jgi:hypothetical protein